MIRLIRLVTIALAFYSCSAKASFHHGSFISSPPVTNSFANLLTCGGGLVVGEDIPVTGVRFVRTDAAFGYLWGTNDSQWHNLVTKASMPAAAFGLNPTTGTSQIWQGPSQGVNEIAGAPSDSTVAYMFYFGRLFVSTNVDPTNPDSIIWTDTGLTQLADFPNGANRTNGHRLAVDPNNKDHVLLGTMQAGLKETTNGTHVGGATWTTVSTAVIPQSTDLGSANSPGYLITFDPSSGVNGSSLTNTLYVFTFSASNPGVYRTTNGSTASLALTSSGPTSGMAHMAMGPTGGVLWAVDQPNFSGSDSDGNVWKFVSGTWTKVLNSVSGGYHTIAINPLNVNHLAAVGTLGGINVSTNGGGAWSGIAGQSSILAGDSAWQTLITVGLQVGDFFFDPLNNDQLLGGAGQGHMTTPLPSGSFSYTTLTKGIEEFIGERIAVPSANSPIVGGQDLGSFAYNSLSNTACHTTAHPLVEAGGVEFGLKRAMPDVVAGNTSFVVEKINDNFGVGQIDGSGTSTDGFTSFANYSPFNTYITKVPASTGVANNGGIVRVNTAVASGGSATTTGLTSWSAGSGSLVCVYGSNKASGFLLSGSCFAATVIDSTHFDLQGSTWDASLATTGGSYAFYVPTTMVSDWNGHFTVSGASSAAGLIQVNFVRAGELNNGWPICISGVLGTTEANGCWITQSGGQSGSSGTVVLGPTSAFTHSYTGGGVIKAYMEPGGAVAAASISNYTFMQANNSIPRCTTDGGQTWSAVTNAAIPVALTTVTGGPYSAGATSITVASGAPITSNGTILEIPLADGRTFSSIFTISSNTVTLTSPIPTGASIANGAGVSVDTGWGFAAFLNFKNVAADRVAANTFFAVNPEVGMLKWTNCGATTLVNNVTNTWAQFGTSNTALKTVPGESGHLFWTIGPQGSEPGAHHPGSNGLWRSCSGDNNVAGAMTMQQVAGFFEPQTLGFGTKNPGNSYPAVYVVGWYDAGNVQANAIYGIWRSTDDANHGNSGAAASCSGGNTWTKIDDFPKGWNVKVFDIEGDPSVYGEVYFTTDSGSFIGMYN
jgi:hypothetical protein